MIYTAKRTTTKIRFLTLPYHRFIHLTDSEVVNCNYTNRCYCNYCTAGLVPERRWIAGVLARGEVGDPLRIFEFGKNLYRSIQQLVQSHFGDPQNYDIEIYFSKPSEIAVHPDPPTELTALESAYKNQITDRVKTLTDENQISYLAHTISEFGYLQTNIDKPGKTCTSCKEFYPYADQNNQADGSFKCYGCRS